MPTDYRVDLYNPNGIKLDAPQPLEGEYALVERDVGVAALTYGPDMPISLLQKDGQITINRSIDGGEFYNDGEATWLIRRRRREFTDRAYIVKVWAVHANHLLTRRVMAYTERSTQTVRTGPADNLIREVVRDNFTAPTVTARTMSGLTVGANLSLAPSLDMTFERGRVLDILRDICTTCEGSGVYLGFEVRNTLSGGLEVVVYLHRRGADRRYGTADYLRVEATSGAIAESSLDEDWTDEATSAFVMGPGKGDDQLTLFVSDQSLIDLTPFGRVETAVQNRESTTTAQLTDAGLSALKQNGAKILYEARAQESFGLRYGVHYRWGDLLTVSDFDRLIDCRADPVRIAWNRNGEQVDVRFTYRNV